MNKSQKYKHYQFVAVVSLVVFLAACAVPEKPEGADQDGFATIGDRLHTRGDARGAASFYQRTLQKNPRDVATRIKLLNLLEASGDKESAKVGYEEGLRYTPDDPDLRRSYGRLLLQMGQADAARDHYEHALQINGKDVRSINGLGVSFDVLRKHGEAQKLYLEALDLESGDMATLNNLGHSYVLSGKVEEAIKLLEPYADNPKAPAALRQNLAEAYGLVGMDADAQRLGLKDLPVKDAARNVEIYKARRKESAPTRYYADLGDFPTDRVAVAHAETVHEKYAAEDDVHFETLPVVKTMGGTPKFSVYVKGFTTMEAVEAFCAKLRHNGVACKAVAD